MATAYRREKIQMRHARLRKKVAGTTQRPRLAVHFSGKNIYAQIIDDTVGKTLASVNTTEAGLKAQKPRANAATAATVGKLVAERAKAKNITQVVFDRGGYIYHGKVKALADAAREGGLQF
jgi:large subunit ribosomal protein L18